MQLLAAVEGDGGSPLSEALIATIPRIRRGMTAVVVTPSLDRSWVKPLATLRSRGVACVVVSIDVDAYAGYARDQELRRAGRPLPARDGADEEHGAARRALRHALTEFEVSVFTVTPAKALGELLAA
jgi:hypothetical protein